MKNNATELTMTPELLGLSDIEIESVRISNNGSIYVRVSSTKEETTCRNCGRPTSPYQGNRIKFYLKSMTFSKYSVFHPAF